MEGPTPRGKQVGKCKALANLLLSPYPEVSQSVDLEGELTHLVGQVVELLVATHYARIVDQHSHVPHFTPDLRALR